MAISSTAAIGMTSRTVEAMNAKRYIDISYRTLDGSALPSTVTSGVPFAIEGPGVADLNRDNTNMPIIVGSLRIAGTATSSSRTWRYYLKDTPNNTATNLFQNGAVDVTFTGVLTGQKQTFTMSAAAPGAAPATTNISVGPLLLQGPSIGIADVGFQGGKLVYMIQRRDIEQRTAEGIADMLTLAFDKYCANEVPAR